MNEKKVIKQLESKQMNQNLSNILMTDNFKGFWLVRWKFN